ncbi:MAG: single-stranded DNA-binding protein [Planctomycetota bacterium]|nr:single-stranded DNA-binding protein [Planctomycetota bacterium]
MASYNRVILMGNLARDPETRQTQSGLAIARSAIAVNERVSDGQGGWKDEASFFNFVFFGKQAESFSRLFQKGKAILIEGRLREDKWQDKESGQNRSKVEIVADRWFFVGGRGEERGEDHGGERSAPAPERAASAPGFPGAGDFGGGFADDVPF